MTELEKIRERFQGDRFATEAAGIEIAEAGVQHALCEMELKDLHRNARNGVMGGAIFTLADFAVAVAANGAEEEPSTVTLHAGITFLSPAKGERLIGEANCIKAGRTTSLYEVVISDELGTQVARAQINGFTVSAAGIQKRERR